MTEDEVVRWILAMSANVDRVIADGSHFFFYNPPGEEPDHRFPFATIVTNNNYDDGSDLDRPGVYRLNVGVSRQTFEALFPKDAPVMAVDRTALDALFPHPDYARMFWLSVLNPTDTWPRVEPLLTEAHAMAKRRHDRRTAGREEAHSSSS